MSSGCGCYNNVLTNAPVPEPKFQKGYWALFEVKKQCRKEHSTLNFTYFVFLCRNLYGWRLSRRRGL